MKLREFVELFDKNDVAVKEKPIAMIQPTEKDGWCAFRRPDGLCELHDRGLKPTEGVLASCKVLEEDNIPTYETSVLRAVAHEWGGIFRTKDGVLLNADVNGSYNIMRKVKGDAVMPPYTGFGYNPVKKFIN